MNLEPTPVLRRLCLTDAVAVQAAFASNPDMARHGYNQLVEKYLCPAWSQTHVRTLVCEPVHNVGSGNSEKS